MPKIARRLGRFLPALHGAAVAQRPRARAPAEHARVHARGLPPRADRQVPHAGAQSRRCSNLISIPARWRLDHHVYAFPGGPVGAQDRAEAADTAEAQGGRAATFRRTGDLLDGELPWLTYSSPIAITCYFDRKQVRKMQPYPPLQTLLAAACLRRAGLSAWRCSTPLLQRPRTASRRRSSAIARAWSRCARTISISSPRCACCAIASWPSGWRATARARRNARDRQRLRRHRTAPPNTWPAGFDLRVGGRGGGRRIVEVARRIAPRRHGTPGADVARPRLLPTR